MVVILPRSVTIFAKKKSAKQVQNSLLFKPNPHI